MIPFSNNYTLKLDIKEQMPNPVIRIVQYDSAYLNIELYDAGQKMNLERGERFTVSTVHEATGTNNTGLAYYDGSQFIVYELRKADMEHVGTYTARFSSYKDRNRVTSLAFRYEVYEDYETTGDASDLTMLQELFNQTEEVGRVTQRQGEYAEDRGDYANAAGDYANRSGDENKLNWLPYVKTLELRNSTYPNPNNGDTVFVIDENKVFRYDGIDAMGWEAISGYDTTDIQNLYNIKADKTALAATDKKLEDLTIGTRNLIRKYDLTGIPTYHSVEKTTEIFQTGLNVFKVTQVNDTANPPVYTHSISTNAISVLPNQEVTASIWIKHSAANPDNSITTLRLYAGTTTYAAATYNKNTDWKRISVSYKNDTTQEIKLNFYVYNPKNLNSIVYLTSPKVEHGTRPTDWTPAPEDVDASINSVNSTLTAYKTSNDNRVGTIETELNTNVVKKNVFNSTIDSQNSRMSTIEQSADNLTSVVSKKVGATQVKSIINQSAESIKIKASNIDFDGAVVFKQTNNVVDPNAFVSIKAGTLVSKGYYERTWRDGKKRNRTQVIQFVDGMLRITDPEGDLIDSNVYGYDYTKDWNDHSNPNARSLYYTSDGISTYRDGTGKYLSSTSTNVSSGTIEFFSHEYSDSRGLTLYSANGAIGLQSNGNKIHIHAANSVHNRSKKSHVVLSPHEDIRSGKNDFTFGVNSGLTGYMIYGDTTTNLGSGFKFSKKQNVIHGVDGSGSPSSKVALNIGKIQADTITSRNGKESVYFNGSGTGNLSSKTSLQADGIVTGSTNFYIGVAGELRVTNKRGYNSGKSIGYLPVKASKFNSVSSRKYKSNIKDLEIDTLDILKQTDIKQYNLNTDLEAGVNKTKYGVILEDSPEVLHEGDAIDIYGMVSILWDVVKKQQVQIDELKEQLRN